MYNGTPAPQSQHFWTNDHLAINWKQRLLLLQKYYPSGVITDLNGLKYLSFETQIFIKDLKKKRFFKKTFVYIQIFSSELQYGEFLKQFAKNFSNQTFYNYFCNDSL